MNALGAFLEGGGLTENHAPVRRFATVTDPEPEHRDDLVA